MKTSSTHYTSKDGRKTLITEMATPHMQNAIRKAERDPQFIEGLNPTITAMKAELAQREEAAEESK